MKQTNRISELSLTTVEAISCLAETENLYQIISGFYCFNLATSSSTYLTESSQKGKSHPICFKTYSFLVKGDEINLENLEEENSKYNERFKFFGA